MMMTVSDQGQITLSENVPGNAEVMADRPKGSWDDLSGFFAGKTNGARLSLEQLGDAIAAAAAATAESSTEAYLI